MSTSAALNNLTIFNPKNVYSSIISHLRSNKKSENTMIAYINDYKQFFMITRNKKLEDLVESDLMFNAEEIDNHQTLLSQTLKNSSVNRKMKSIFSLYNSLKRYKYNVDIDAMEVPSLPDDSVAHGFLTLEETETMSELALQLDNGSEKSAFIKVATRTSLRKSDIISLKYSMLYADIENEGDFLFDIIVKKTGEIETKELSGEIVEQLYLMKTEDDMIFHISIRDLQTMFELLCDKMKLDRKGRRLSIHSLRKIGGGYLHDLGYSDSFVADQLGHKSIETSRKWYLKKGRNIAGKMMDNKISDNIYEQLSKEELVKLLMGVKDGIGLQLKRKAKGIIDGREINEIMAQM